MSAIEEVPTAALVEAAQKAPRGDHSAFAELVRRHEGAVLANCLHLTRSREDAEDLAQDVFVKSFFALGKFRREADFKTWIYRIKINHCLNYLRKRRQEIFVDITAPASAAESALWVLPTAGGERSDRIQAARRVLESLPDALRVPLILCDMDGLQYQEAAAELSIGISALKMRIKRGRQLFRERFDLMLNASPRQAANEQQEQRTRSAR